MLGQKNQNFAWLTDQSIDQKNVQAIAAQTGRVRCQIENQGFNIQKNSGLNLEHAYSTHPGMMKAFYYLLQIAHLFLQIFEKGNPLHNLTKRYKSANPIKMAESLRNLAQWLQDDLYNFGLPAEVFEPWPGQIRIFDSS